MTSNMGITWEAVRNTESSLHLEPWNLKLHFNRVSRPFACTLTFENRWHGSSLRYRPGLMLNVILSYSFFPHICLHCVQNHNHCWFQCPGTNQTFLSSLLTSPGEIGSIFSECVCSCWTHHGATAKSRECTWWRGLFSWSGSCICKQKRIKLKYQWEDNGKFWFEQQCGRRWNCKWVEPTLSQSSSFAFGCAGWVKASAVT